MAGGFIFSPFFRGVEHGIDGASYLLFGRGQYRCQIGQTHICANDIIIGIAQDGCFAEYLRSD